MSVEVCPNCGGFSDALDSVTGWCSVCSPISGFCQRCGSAVELAQKRRLCPRCRTEDWYARNADAIESYMVLGHSFNDARNMVSSINRTYCVNCGKSTQRGLFCIATPCQSKARKYNRYRNKGLPKDEALERTLERKA